jgi:hypothetical protein
MTCGWWRVEPRSSSLRASSISPGLAGQHLVGYSTDTNELKSNSHHAIRLFRVLCVQVCYYQCESCTNASWVGHMQRSGCERQFR